jgi:hypothetical protein
MNYRAAEQRGISFALVSIFTIWYKSKAVVV